MYDAHKIKVGFKDLIGWRQNPDPQGERIVDLLESQSGKYFNDEHPLLTLENLWCIAPDSEQYDFPLFDETNTSYLIGDVVKDDEDVLYYRLKTGNGIGADFNADFNDDFNNTSNQQPLSNRSFWKVYTPFTQWLLEKTESGILKAIEDWHSSKFKKNTARNLLSRDTVFDIRGDFDQIQEKTGSIVGHRVTLRRSSSILATVTAVSLQLDTNQAVTIKVFKKGVKESVYEHPVMYVGNGGVQWFDIKFDLQGDKGDDYFIAYDESQLVGNAINGLEGLADQFHTGKFYDLSSFRVDGDFTEMWNQSDVSFHTSTNYGLNYKLNVRCDYTNFILDQKDLFKTVAAKSVAISLLRQIAFNPNAITTSNIKQVDTKMVLYEIDGDSQGEKGNNNRLGVQYQNALNDIQFDMTGIDRICLTNKRRGIKIRGVR